jgi:hypothetical protein
MEETTQTLLATFKNSLVYTACARQVTVLLDENAGGAQASLLLMISFGFLAVIFQTAKKQIVAYAKRYEGDPALVEWNATIATLRGVSEFVLDLSSNLATQMVSSMAAQTISDAVTGGDNVVWSLLGALVCIILLWLLTITVENKYKSVHQKSL